MTTASHVEPERDRKIAAAIVWIGSALGLLAGAVFLGFGQFETSEMHNALDKLAPDGNAEGFDVERIGQIQSRASVAGLALLALVVCLTVLREKASHYIAALLAVFELGVDAALKGVAHCVVEAGAAEPARALAPGLCSGTAPPPG